MQTMTLRPGEPVFDQQSDEERKEDGAGVLIKAGVRMCLCAAAGAGWMYY